MRILAIDVGGTHVKALVKGARKPRKFDSGRELTPTDLVAGIEERCAHWTYDVVSIGYPGYVLRGKPIAEPKNLGRGWVGFDFAAAFRRPTRLINDAAMQALGSYRGGHMLFLGLGTGLGSAFVVDGVVEPMEIAHLPYKKGRTYEDYLGKRGLARLGKKHWRRAVADVVERLATALEADSVVLGGGNAELVKDLPPRTRRGSNAFAFRGGFLLWDDPTWPTRGGRLEPRQVRGRRKSRARG